MLKAFPFRGFERLENSPVDCMNASLDALWALQRERAGRPMERWRAAPDEVFSSINSNLPCVPCNRLRCQTDAAALRERDGCDGMCRRA